LALLRQKGDKPDKKRVVEDEEDDPKTAVKKRVEDEDDKTRKHKVVRVDEDEEKPTTRPAEAIDMARAANEAKHPNVKALFASLAVPYDEVTLRGFVRVKVSGSQNLGGKLRVAPVSEYVTDVRDLKNKLELKVIDAQGKELKTETLGAESILSIRYHERIAMEAIKDFLVPVYTSYDQSSSMYLTRYDQLVAADQALSAVMRFHQSAGERGVRKGAAWETIADELRKQLLDVQLLELDELTEHKAWDQAFVLTRRLAETYTRAEDHKRIAKPLAELLKKALKDQGYQRDRMKEARLRLRQFEDAFPGSEMLQPIRDTLRDQAKELFEQAKALIKEKKPAEALPLLKRAAETWPELPGLRALTIATDTSYQILRVNVRELPKYLSPGWAVTDAELRAVDLLFESLVNLLPDEQGMLYYRPSLAVGRPKVIPLGRQFKLPRGALWSDGGALTAGDLRTTVKLLKGGQGTGRAAVWGTLLNNADVRGDPFQVKLIMERGFLDPLSVMSFKVLPNRTRPAPASEAFARKPISSGPFTFGGRLSEDGREYVAFLANPHYGVRVDKLGLPLLKEVRFFSLADPVKELKDRFIDLALDLTAEQAAALRGNFEVPLPTMTTPNRRIYFLAVNHRKAPLAHADVRIALARAINREQLLDNYFRKGLDRKVHLAINGPYPARSWACNPALGSRNDKTSLDPYDPDLARTTLKQVMPKLGVRELRLTLKYPSGDKQLAEAMKDLCEKVNKTLSGVRLVPEERLPHDLRADVEETQSYDLAYYHYDFPDESYWLKPLLGPSGREGRDNYLGYNGSLAGRIESAMMFRHFTQVREFAHVIHRQFLDSEMPFLPLWQLTPLYASRGGRVRLPVVDANRIFAEVEKWRVGQGAGRGARQGK
jgi:hypothetical protein